ncbi:hypothetical protein [Otariodibacter oris]|uniref:SMI1/KNR4 family protein SUKH-1 n=1 Tax=Otariodibacter oris TaxID=1032623 RepID=A0A420XI12_9PAST|nr:hypothetical protein [Otariodibacter oris]QGM81036.1 hypothetical protein A6A10_06265 [Otariodibacter oris]RKR76781.1 hypothetical protein DES31_0088 [Otariodibacter oris]
MKLKNKIEILLAKQDMARLKNESEKQLTSKVLNSFGVKNNSEFYKLYTKYFLGCLEYRDGASEIVDPCPPQSFNGVIFAHEVWGIPKNYILFTTGEGEGGYLYNTEDNSVWDFTLGEQDLLGTDKMKHWDSFYAFLEWYLIEDDGMD